MTARCKVLHVVRAMDRGGVETWLMNVLRNIDRSRFEFHFLVNTPGSGSYDEEIRRIGGVIHHGPDPHRPASFASRLASLLKESGPFDAIHSHLYYYSGIVLKVAKEASVPVRIAHSHTSRRTSRLNIARRSYEAMMRRALARCATDRLAVSRQAGEALFGKADPPGFRILYYGLDFTRFGHLESRPELQRRLGIPRGRIVLGHVGRFVPVKNHEFLLEVFHSVLRQENAHLLLVGNGPLLPAIMRRVTAEGIRERCTFTGLTEDVAPCIGAMHLLLLPSLWEGLPLVTLEAQAAAVPVLASDAVTREIDVLPGMVEHMPLRAGAEEWAATSLRSARMEGCRRRSAELMERSCFSLEKCIGALGKIYEHASQTNPLGAIA